MAASWECPSLPMLSFPLKESAQSTFLGIKPMISAHYEEDGDSFQEEIKQLDALRQNALRPPKDYNGVSVLRRYFAQLHLIRERFPPETIGQLPIDFVWKDAYTDAQYVQEGLQIEQASILYNISALHSMLGCRVKRSNEQEMKEAVTHFQCAAGAYSYLDEHFAVNHASKDLSAQFVSLYKSLMLGQAQECLVEKSLKGVGRVKNLTIAKLAIRVSEYYLNVSRLLETDPCNVIVKKHKDWPKLLRMKVFYYQAVSHFYQGCHAEELGKQGELIAWLQLSLQKLTTIGKIPKSLGDVREAAKNFFDHVNERLQVVKRQNDQVYHDPIPEADTLEQTTGADLVKPVAFQPSDSKNLGRDIFSRLVPMRAYEAASVYSEEKAKLLRSVVSSVQEKNEELEQYLLSLNATEIDKINQGPPKTPDEVLQQHKLLQGKSMLVKKLHSDIQELMKLSGEVTDDLTLIAEKRKEDTNSEEMFQSRQGQRSASQITTSLWKEADNFSKFHSQASKSNAELKGMFDQHYQYLLLLSGPIATLHAAVPKITAMDTPAENSTDSARWKELMGKIEEMKKQRKALVGQLRDQINRDDITKTLIGHLGSDKEVFIDEQMRQHREIADIIRKNLEAQENILKAVTEENVKKVQVRQTVQELTQQQESMFNSLVKAGTTFPLLQSKISEGLGFYVRLHGNVTKLRKRVLDVVAARQSERDSTERRRTPDRSVSPAPELGHHATPPPRPPKKAEFAGNPLAPEHQVLPNEAHHHVMPPPGGQSSQPASHPPLTPPPQASAGQSIEDQLQELQRQQQMQLQALQGLNVTGDGGLDLHSLQSVVPPNQSLPTQVQPGPNQLLVGGVPTQQVSTPPPIEQMSLPPQGVPTQHVMPNQQFQPPNVPNQQFQPPNVPTQQVPPAGVPNEQLMTAGTPTDEQGDLLGLDSGGQAALLQAPLQPMDTELNQDTMRAIEDLQMLLQPPGTEALGGMKEQPPDLGGSREQSMEQENRPPEQIASLEAVVEGRDLQNETMPPRPSEIEPPVSEGVCSPGGGSTLPDVLQVGNAPIEPDTPDQSIQDHSVQGQGLPAVQQLNESTITISSISRPIPAPIQSPPPSITTQSLPQPEHIQSPPPAIDGQMPTGAPMHTVPPQAHLPSEPPAPVHSALPDALQSGPPPIHTPPAAHNQPHLPEGLSPTLHTDHSLLDESTAQEFDQTEPVGFQSVAHLQDGTPGPETETSPEIVPHSQTMTERESGEQSTEANTQHEPQPSDAQTLHLEQPADVRDTTFRPIPIPTPTENALEMQLSTSVTPGDNISVAPSDNLSSSTSSLPQLPENVALTSLQPIQSFAAPPVGPLSLPTPPSVSPLPPELTMPLQDYHSLQTSTGPLSSHFDSSHYENLITKKDEKIEELQQENEKQRAQIADQRIQMESYKQQLLLLQQQVAQVSVQQQKHEQEKMASTGQQAVLMQLLQQQQGMFSQQQAQLENISKVTEAHRKEQQELESSYKQALAVEREQKNTLQSQLMQQTQELQRLQQQLQAQAQQYQTVQLQLHQYHTQIQERDKQLMAFREQHKQILQTLDQKHQQKTSQLMQQLHEYQAEVKKLRSQRPGIMTPLQPSTPQQFVSPQGMRPTGPASVPGHVAPQPVSFPGQLQPNQAPPTPVSKQHGPRPFNQPVPETPQQPLTPQQVQPQRPPQLQNFPTGGPGPQLPPPMQPTSAQGVGTQDSTQQRFQGFQQGQTFQPTAQQGGTQQGFQQPPGQVPTSQQSMPPQSGGGQLMRQDSQPFRPPEQQQVPGDGSVPPTSSFGFMPRQDGGQNWQQTMTGGNRMSHPSGTPQPPTAVAAQPGQAQYGQPPPGVQQGMGQTPQLSQGQHPQILPQQYQPSGGQFQPRPGGMAPQFPPAPQQFSQQQKPI